MQVAVSSVRLKERIDSLRRHLAAINERTAVVIAEMAGLSASISDLNADLQLAQHRTSFCHDMLRAIDSSDEVSRLIQADAGLADSSSLLNRAERLQLETAALAERLEQRLARTDKAPWEESEIAKVQADYQRQSQDLAVTFGLLEQRQGMESELSEALERKSEIASLREAPRLQHLRLSEELEMNYDLANWVAREVAALESDAAEHANKPWKQRLTSYFERAPPTWEKVGSRPAATGRQRPISAAPVRSKAATQPPAARFHCTLQPKEGPPRLLHAAEVSSEMQPTSLASVTAVHSRVNAKVWQVAVPADARIDSLVDVLCGAERVRVREIKHRLELCKLAAACKTSEMWAR